MAKKGGIQIVYWQNGKRKTFGRTFTASFMAKTMAKKIAEWYGVESVEVIDWMNGGLLGIFEKSILG